MSASLDIEQQGSVVEEKEECCICLDELENNKKTMVLLCNHRFHKKCIKDVREASDMGHELIQCPLCRCVSFYPRHRMIAMCCETWAITMYACSRSPWVCVLYVGVFLILAGMSLAITQLFSQIIAQGNS